MTRLLSGSPAVVAHRGNSSVAPQNTLAAFEAAAAADADAIEIDVQLSADGAVVVIHDATVDATTDGSGAVDALSLAELRALDAGSWRSEAFAGQRIPTLDDVLDVLRRHPRTDLLIEFKGPWAADDVRAATGAVTAAGLADRVVVQSFERSTVAALRDVAPDLPRALLIVVPDDDVVAVCADLGAVACNPPVAAVKADPGLVGRLHDAGLRVIVWTANDPREWQTLTTNSVDAIITDRPDRLRGWLEARAAS